MDKDKIKRSTSKSSAHYIGQTSKKSILTPQKHINPLKVILNGVDVTPKSINPLYYKGGKERQVTVLDIHASGSTSIQLGNTSRLFKAESTLLKLQTEYNMTTLKPKESNIYTTYLSADINDTENVINIDEPESEKSGADISQVSVGPPRELPKMPPYITLTIQETETVIILDLPSSTAEKDTPEGNAAEADNKYYEYITEGKGKNRKVVHAEVQTSSVLSKTRITEARGLKNVNHFTFASLWDMYDTFLEQRKDVESNHPVTQSITSIDSMALPKEDIQWRKLLQNNKFLDSVCIMQRILANNVFNEQQKRFRGLSDPSPFRENIEFKYTLHFLWTFSNDDTRGRCVSSMCWNPVNKDILAVGYGKFYYDEEAPGMVLIWNIKNPVQPERDYNFQHPVTSTSFSDQNPNFLAIGFYNGDIKVIDINKRIIDIVGTADKETSKLYEPIWQVSWYTDYDYYKGQEFLAATCQNGRICKFRLNMQHPNMHYGHMMKITSAEGKLKGIETLRKCPSKVVSLSRNSPALVYTPHPADPNIYYIGSSEGVVHKCSKNYYHQHLDLFLAHDSPMYNIVFSPFCSKLFLTCGDDWAIRLWADAISEPLFEIKKKPFGVQGVAWSPSHSTIIASISGNEIYIWDLQRKTYDSQSITLSPTKSRNTLIQFTPDGRCLFVADIDGNVHVFSLEDMPFPAFFQENLLTESIKRSLVTRPDLLNRIDKLGSLSFDMSQYEKYKTNA